MGYYSGMKPQPLADDAADALPSKETILCWQCGESNPKEAVMCWACYSSFFPGKGKERHALAVRVRKLRDGFGMALPLGGLALAIASGYSGKNWWRLLGLAALSLGTSFTLAKRQERVVARMTEEEGTPIERIANTILLYAARDKASQIRLTAGLNMNVKFLISDEWHEQMKLPDVCWPGLREHFFAQSGGSAPASPPQKGFVVRPDILPNRAEGKHSLVFENDGRRFEFSLLFVRDSELPIQTLTLTLRP